MSPRWFRVAYARNAFLRCLDGLGLSLDELTPATALRAMVAFREGFRPQHGEIDSLELAWGPAESGAHLTFTRRLKREHEPESPLVLTLTLARSVDPGRATITSVAEGRATASYPALARARVLGRSLEQSPSEA